jgi:hypothetical protein
VSGFASILTLGDDAPKLREQPVLEWLWCVHGDTSIDLVIS